MHLADDADAATGLAFRHVRDGDVVLVKGSNGMRTPALMRNLLKGPPPHNGESHVA
jgi:UDP-N-acetylmuramyl pentapeptide synthase